MVLPTVNCDNFDVSLFSFSSVNDSDRKEDMSFWIWIGDDNDSCCCCCCCGSDEDCCNRRLLIFEVLFSSLSISISFMHTDIGNRPAWFGAQRNNSILSKYPVPPPIASSYNTTNQSLFFKNKPKINLIGNIWY